MRNRRLWTRPAGNAQRPPTAHPPGKAPRSSHDGQIHRKTIQQGLHPLRVMGRMVLIVGTMIKGTGPAVWYVAPNGMRYHVPDTATVMCLGGWSAIRFVSDSQLSSISPDPWDLRANCQTPLYGKLIKGSGPQVDYVRSRGSRYWVPTSAVVNRLGGWDSLVTVRDSRFNAILADRHGISASCNAPRFDRLIRKADGQYDYVSAAGARYWVLNHSISTCLGWKEPAVFLSNSRFDGIRRNPSGAWAGCSTKNLWARTVGQEPLGEGL